MRLNASVPVVSQGSGRGRSRLLHASAAVVGGTKVEMAIIENDRAFGVGKGFGGQVLAVAIIG